MNPQPPTSNFQPPTSLAGRVIWDGRTEGEALVSSQPVGFLGGVDPETGVVIEPGHPLEGQCVAGRVLVFPGGKGSTVGSYTLLRLARSGHAPAAMITAQSEPIVAVGAILADIPMLDSIDITQIRTGDWVTVDGEQVQVSRTPASNLQPSASNLQPPTSDFQPPREELVFLKLGGSLITDKTREGTARPEVIRRLAEEVAEALAARPGLRLVLGHGSGSFGHVAGERYSTRRGVGDAAGWRGFAETAVVAQRLNRLVTDAFWQEGVPVWSLQPSASARCRDGELVALDWRPIAEALQRGLAPLVYGDVALDDVRGGTIISTEEIFAWLARWLKPDRIVLAGAVSGVVRSDTDQAGEAQVIAEITPQRLAGLSPIWGDSHGTDVTGGMLAKVRTMCALVQELPHLQVRLISGQVAGLLTGVLGDAGLEVGTVIRADAL